jgi:hypothetical protein
MLMGECIPKHQQIFKYLKKNCGRHSSILVSEIFWTSFLLIIVNIYIGHYPL